MMRQPWLVALSLVATILCLSGCAEVLFAGAATTMVAANDRRTTGAIIDDKTMQRKVDSAIDADPALQDVHINVDSYNGVVLLTGEAQTTELRDKALTAARSVQGVRRIVNEIRVAPTVGLLARTNDSWLTAKIRTRLSGVEDLDALQIKIVTDNGVVYLLGLVKPSEGDKAATAASEVDGVQRVVKLFEYIN